MSSQTRKMQRGSRFGRDDLSGHPGTDGQINLKRALGGCADEDRELHLVALGIGLGISADRLGVSGVLEPEVIPEIDRREADQVAERLADREPGSLEIDVTGGSGGGCSGEETRATFQHPLGARVLGEDAGQEAVEVLQVDARVDVERLTRCPARRAVSLIAFSTPAGVEYGVASAMRSSLSQSGEFGHLSEHVRLKQLLEARSVEVAPATSVPGSVRDEAEVTDGLHQV